MKKTKYGDYQKRIRFKMFSNYDIYVVFTNDIAKSRKARYGTAGLAEGANGLHTQGIGGKAHLFFLIANSSPQIIAHECYHAIYGMLVGWMEAGDAGNEVYAYLVGWLVGQVHKFKEAL